MNVLIFESGIDQIIKGNNYDRNINVIYYDEEYGIIGFDDLNDNKWRLKN